MDHGGATIGPLIAGGMMAAFAMGVDTVILWSIVPGLGAVVLAAVALRDQGDGSGGARAERPAGPGAGSTPPAGLFWLVLAFAAVRMPETLFLLRLQDLGVAAPLIPALWAALHVVRTMSSYPGGWLSDRVGPARTMLVGWLCYAAVAAGMAAATGPWGAGLILLGLGLVSSFTESPERALVAAWGGRARRGRGFGLYHAGVGVAALPGGLALGALYQWEGGTIAMAGSAGLVLILGVVGAGVLFAGARRV